MRLRKLQLRAGGLVGGAVCLLMLFGACVASVAAETRKPNIIFLLADDLGYGDIGVFGQKKIRTPNLDRMAAEGMRFTQHYSGNAVCAPSRCVLMTGKHPGHAWIRDNREVKPEGQPPLPADSVTLAKLLKQQGYRTAAMGKWGLGYPGSEGEPLKQGFDRFFGYNCQRQAHNYYPTNLWDDDRRMALKNESFSPHQKLPAGVDAKDPKAYAAYTGKEYAPDLIREQALKFIRENSGRPFFLYFATTVPHLALQVPEDSLAEYQKMWPETPYPGTNGYLPHLAPRAAYAAMVTRLDRDIGQMIALVRELGLDDNTIFIFTSDNGPLYNKLGGTDADFFESAGGLNGRKGSLYEGGIRVPLVVRWRGQIAAGKICERVTGFEDWLPTIMEMVGTKPTLSELDGVSFASSLFGRTQPERPFLYREFPGYGGQQMVRMGDWKAIRRNLNAGRRQVQTGERPGKLELYNLREDVGETKDVSAEHPEVIAKLERVMRQEHVNSTLFPFRALDAEKR